MKADFLAGQQSVCFVALFVLVLTIFRSRRREQFLDAVLSGAVLLLCAIALEFVNRTYVVWNWDDSATVRIFRGAATALSVVSGALILLSFFFRKASKQNGNRWTALAVASIPVWAAGLVWIFTRETALFSIAETFSIIIVVCFYQGNAERFLERRAEEIENRQSMLFQWQMRPHFLFNTMNTIRELLDSNPALASEGLDNLAGYLRKNLDALTFDHMIPFEQELEHIEQYVMLEKMNPANQFEVIYDLQIIDFSLPALSVQPLVENAIRHGVRSLGDEGLIFVVTERHGDAVRIIVEDNGPGFSGDETERRKEHSSQGLENVRRRLETQCGGSLHVRSDENGTRLIVIIPKKSVGGG